VEGRIKMAFCDVCDERILNDGEDSYVLSKNQMAKLVVDKEALAAFEFTGMFKSGYATVCDTCISKGYVSPFNTRKTYPSKDKLTESELRKSKEISLALGRGETVSPESLDSNTNIDTNPKDADTDQQQIFAPTGWKQVIITSIVAGLLYGILYRFFLEGHEKIRMIVFVIIWFSLMASIKPFLRKAVGFILFLSCTAIWATTF
jgi:hypothetical protein